jgi:hypothetical protein
MARNERKAFGLVVMAIVVGVSPCATRFAEADANAPAASGPAEDIQTRARETKNYSFAYRNRRMFRGDSWEDGLIGGLVENNYWRNDLPLGPIQAITIKKLDELVQKAADNSTSIAADYMDTNPPDYRQYNARLNRRLLETLRHAERMVSLGLLTDAQAALVLQHRITGSGSPLYVLYDKNVQELLAITPNQIKEFEKVGNDANRREARLNLWTVDPKEQEIVRTRMAANAKQMNAEALNVLTPNQRELWSLLSAPRSLPAKASNLPALSEFEAARIKVEDLSSIFRVLSQKPDSLKLSDPQKKFLNQLEVITRTGLHWLRMRNPSDAAPAPLDGISQEFLKHAEQVALLGILTEKQAEQVESAIK